MVTYTFRYRVSQLYIPDGTSYGSRAAIERDREVAACLTFNPKPLYSLFLATLRPVYPSPS